MSFNGTDRPDYSEFTVRLRGLPWSTAAADIMEFFKECRIQNGLEGVTILENESGRPTGIAFLDLESEADVLKALELNREFFGPNWVEVKRWYRKRLYVHTCHLDCSCVRLEGLPFEYTNKDIAQLFAGLELKFESNGIMRILDQQGRKTKNAYVKFQTKKMAEEAVLKLKDELGLRKIKVFVTTFEDREKRRMDPNSSVSVHNITTAVTGYRGVRGGYNNLMEGLDSSWWSPEGTCMVHRRYKFGMPITREMGFKVKTTDGLGYAHWLQMIYMRNLPDHATVKAVIDFFHPTVVQRVDIDNGRAAVAFRTSGDVRQAIKKHNEYCCGRRIQLSKAPPSGALLR